ncbi:MAG: Fe-S cluster assembly ATPase SufC [Desulfurococcales archaeon]|nr:Fe-S cluster assembly ATPase SufC [Desulfurococcales archaeon]MCE4605385.1 Fe-S cluster assembly ATPase SufC [Desulfurococcales archaeon]
MSKGLEVVDLHVNVYGKKVLKGVSLNVGYGAIHAIMGPNGSGKSTLAYTVMGREGYEVEQGDIRLDGESILDLPTEERALKGLFMALQDPPQIPGVRLTTLMIAALNKRQGSSDLTRVRDPKVVRRMYSLAEELGLSRDLLQREINVGFSGGEKKRSELLQALVVRPKIIILDEPDSGLDVDGVKKVSEYLVDLKAQGHGIMLITHYARMFKYVKPDMVTVLLDGRVAVQGGPELADLVEERGYAYIRRRYVEGKESTI